MDLEERTIEQVGDRCEECGAKLTDAEIRAALDSGGPALCSVHAAEDEPGLAADEADFGPSRPSPRGQATLSDPPAGRTTEFRPG